MNQKGIAVRIPLPGRKGRPLLLLEGDPVIWVIVTLMLLLSTLAVYSSISILGYKHHSTSHILLKHLVIVCCGFACVYVVHRINYTVLMRFARIILWIALLMLAYTLVFGISKNSADRWIRIPMVNLTFQTSDLAKIALVIYLAKSLVTARKAEPDNKRWLYHALGYSALVCLLILPSNFSTAALVALIAFFMLALGGLRLHTMLKLAGSAVLLLLLVIAIGESFPKKLPRYQTWKNRIVNKMNPDAEGNFQTNIARVAIYQGGFLPNGPGTGLSRNSMPHSYSDMIFAFIIEEYGSLLGGLVLIMFYLILFYRTIRIASRSHKLFGTYLSLGLVVLIVLQAFVNMLVGTNLIPTTGQPLPLLSLGGTSTIMNCITIGLILSVARQSQLAAVEHKAAVAGAAPVNEQAS